MKNEQSNKRRSAAVSSIDGEEQRERNLRSKANNNVEVDVDGMIMVRCNIPEEIIVEILSRLPAQSILQCQQVCKAWRDLLRHPSFAQIHFLHRRRLILSEEEQQLDNDHHNAAAGKELGFVYFDVNMDSSRSKSLSYVEFDEISNKTLVTRMHHPKFIGASFIGSSYGLIWIRLADSCLYICNPIKDEYTLLPKHVCYSTKGSFFTSSRIAVGFGYHPSTNQYKAVRICRCSKMQMHPFPSRVEVYTLGAGSGWRDRGEINFNSFYVRQRCFSLSGKLANGALYWLCDEGKIVAFDLADEELHYLSLPSCFSPRDNTIKLLVLGGGLCVRRYNNGDAKSVEIWSLKKSGEWEIMFRVAAHQGMNGDNFVPLALVKRGEALSSYNDKFLCRYDPKTGIIDNFVQFGELPSSLARHMHTFVSLKGLGEEKVGNISRMLNVPQKVR